MRRVERLLAEILAHPQVRPLALRLKGFDLATYRHSLRVSRAAIALAEADKMDAQQVREIAVAALLHDLGKADVDLDLLNKPSSLDEEEREHLQHHAASAVGDLQDLGDFPDAHRIAPLHHELQGEESYPRKGRERRDPSRVPAGDRRRQIPSWITRAGRILALADRYDALVSRRPYKAPMADPLAREQLRREMPDVCQLLPALPAPHISPR